MEEEFDMPGADMETLRRAFFRPGKPPKSGAGLGRVSVVGGDDPGAAAGVFEADKRQ